MNDLKKLVGKGRFCGFLMNKLMMEENEDG